MTVASTLIGTTVRGIQKDAKCSRIIIHSGNDPTFSRSTTSFPAQLQNSKEPSATFYSTKQIFRSTILQNLNFFVQPQRLKGTTKLSSQPAIYFPMTKS